MSVRFWSLGAAAAAIPLAIAAVAPTVADAQPRMHEITITISRVRAVDSPDAFSKADFFARVAVDRDAVSTEPVRQQTSIRPNWTIVKRVAPGVHNVKLEVIDKDLSVDDPIDINAVDNKRDLDFTIDTRSCRIQGFSTTYRCGTTIARTGQERKAAMVEFSVSVRR